MRFRTAVLSATATDLQTLLGLSDSRARVIMIQAPAANAADAYLGEASQQPYEFPATGGDLRLDATVNLSTLYAKGGVGDKLTVIFE